MATTLLVRASSALSLYGAGTPDRAARGFLSLENNRAREERFVGLRVLGIDPGLARTGYAIVEEAGSRLYAPAIGVIKTLRGTAISERLCSLEEALLGILGSFEPECVALERVYFQVNAKSAIQVGEAAGVVLLVAGKFGLDVFGYSPNEVKRALTGYGAADKKQMASMTARLLGLEPASIEADAADAAAVAVAHLNSSRLAASVRRAL
ncbi:MAG: crossover junction endodeoxyribonuclease RuvC [Acidimicrobiia bacterium]